MNAELFADSCMESTVEAAGYYGTVVDTKDGSCVIAALATGQGPLQLAGAGVNAFLKGLADIASNGDGFTPETDIWKATVVEIFKKTNAELLRISKSLSVQATVSACAVLITPAGNLSVVSAGNVSCFIISPDTSTVMAGNYIDTAARQKKPDETPILEPEHTLLVTAMGNSNNIRARATRAALSGSETIVLLSGGFARNVDTYYETIRQATDIRLLPPKLINDIKNQRGRACADAVLAVMLKGGEEYEQRNYSSEA